MSGIMPPSMGNTSNRSSALTADIKAQLKEKEEKAKWYEDAL
jgi:Uma2 family endonuclease